MNVKLHFSLLVAIVAQSFCGFTANAQTTNPGCDGTRYLQKTFTVNAAPTTVTYGRNTGATGAQQSLKMDIYQPDNDAAATARPVLILAFGGSFITGTRADAATVKICKAWAARGYVTVSIDYRLYSIVAQGLPDSLKFGNVVTKAVSDMKAAVRWMRKSAATGNPYRINPDIILAGGISSGSITAMHAAYLTDDNDAGAFIKPYIVQNGGIRGNTDDPTGSTLAYSESIQGIVDYMGGLYRSDILDAGEPPIASIHGDADATVPYGFGYAVVSGINIISINGSKNVYNRANTVGVPAKLIRVPGGGHGDFFSNATWMDSIERTSVRLMYDNVVCPYVATQNAAGNAQISVYPNPTSDAFFVSLNELQAAYTVNVTDALGRVVRTLHTADSTVRISRDGLPQGAYFVQIKFDDAHYKPITSKVVFE